MKFLVVSCVDLFAFDSVDLGITARCAPLPGLCAASTAAVSL
jgi:hypothetical protein